MHKMFFIKLFGFLKQNKTKHGIKKFWRTLDYSAILDNHKKKTMKGNGFLVLASFYTDLGLQPE